MKGRFVFFSWIMISAALSQVNDLGTFGQTFEIQERSLLEVIQTKLKDLEERGVLKDHQQDLVEKVKETLKNPQAVAGITKTTQPRTFTYDTSIMVPYDMKDNQGTVFQKQGTVVNPLHTHSLTKPLLFIDGDDRGQVVWVLHQQEERQRTRQTLPKLILVKGSPFDLMETHNVAFYFDQKGILTKKLGITQVPARVTQTEDVLTIEEVKLDEK